MEAKKVIAVVALIEDDSTLRETYEIILDAEGFEAISARSGLEGLKLVAEKKPDVILLDMIMPDLHGLDFLKQFNAKAHPETKVYVFSNLSDPDQMQKAMELGAWKYLVKADFTPTQVTDQLKEDLKSSKK